MLRPLAIALTCLAAAAAPAAGADRMIIKGAGWGHGIGMSQFGAYGYATHGFDYKTILHNYYSETSLGTADQATQIRVLLHSTRSLSFSGAASMSGRKLSATRTYKVTASGDKVFLRSGSNRVLLSDAALRATPRPGGKLRIGGTSSSGLRNGLYRGALEVRASGSRVLVINAVSLESYVRGVISAESPATWPAEALKAQAVAARTYAITTKAGPTLGFEQYADTRSQMYRGVAAERPSTDAAVAATKGEVVTYGGRPAVTYFFSTSGGHTENIEYSFIGALPKPWLRGVDDPFDDASPKHRWTVEMSLASADAKLGSLVKGKLKAIKVLKRGVSPRIVRAQVVGTEGTTEVTGPALRKTFGLNDTWASFQVVDSAGKAEPGQDEPPAEPLPPAEAGGQPPPRR
jgi:stage II sporulation protein D